MKGHGDTCDVREEGGKVRHGGEGGGGRATICIQHLSDMKTNGGDSYGWFVMYKAKNNSGRKGCYAMCGGGRTDVGRAIHFRLL